MNYSAELDFAKELARKSGAIARSFFSLELTAAWKQDNTPLTEADTSINRLVIELVNAQFPLDNILGEEESHMTGGARTWVVDPIDGTMPFSCGMPLSTFCLALVVDGQPVLGVIYDPWLERMFWAEQGKGAFVNDQRLQVSRAASLAQNFIMISSRMGDDFKTSGQLFDAVEKSGAKAMNFRSFAYGSTYVAAGKLVGSVIGMPYAWDVAATKIIIEEAGGKVTDLYGNERRYDGDGLGLVASNGYLHEELLAMIRA